MPNILDVLIENIENVILGKREMIEKLIISLISKGHVLIEDIPGTGKTQLASALAMSISGVFKRVQFTPDLMPSDIVGFSMFNQATREFEYRPGAAMCNFLLADEINRASPKTQSSLLEIMEEYQVSVDGETRMLPEPFMVIATQNPIENFGTFPLPEAQLDRFFMKFSLGYADKQAEKKVLENFSTGNVTHQLKPVLSGKHIIQLQEYVKRIAVHSAILDYVLNLVQFTRDNPQVVLGVSTRGALHLVKAAKAVAVLSERKFVIPDDVRKVAVDVLAHRMILNQEAKYKNLKTSDIIKAALDHVEVPKF